MKPNDKLNVFRILSCLGMLVSAIVSAAILCLTNHLEFDEVFCMMVVILGIMPVIFLEMAYERRRNLIANNTQTQYRRIARGFYLCCLLMLGGSLLPEFCRPVMLIALIMVAFSNENIAVLAVTFLNTLLVLTTGGSFHELLTYTLLTVLAIVPAKILKNKEYRLYMGLIMGVLHLLLSGVFYYLTNEKISLTVLIYGAVNGLIAALYGIFLFPKNEKKTIEEIHFQYEHLLTEDYSLLREIANYSQAEYKHACKVSKLGRQCATILGLKEDLVAAAGMFYRLGRLEGEPVVAHGVELGEKHCFPEELLQILREYGALEALPSTPESALIHMIDSILLKIELLDKQVGGSKWNKEVLIYQTLNESSTAGIYDKSGLSINAFIKIREFLAKEDM